LSALQFQDNEIAFLWGKNLNIYCL